MAPSVLTQDVKFPVIYGNCKLGINFEGEPVDIASDFMSNV